MQKQSTKTKVFFIASLCLIILVSFSSYWLPFGKTVAVGGGFESTNTKITTVNATTATIATVPTYNIKGNLLVVMITTFNPSITVSSIADTVGNTFSQAVGSHVFEDDEIWYANYTKTNFAADTITVTFSGSTSSAMRLWTLTGTVTGSLQTTTNSGTATSASVASFTPNANFACLNSIAANTGSITGTTWGDPNFWYVNANLQLTSLAFDLNALISNNWANYGATTATSSMTPTSSPQWDDVIACFPQGPSTVTSTTTTTTTTPTTSTTISPTTTTTVSPTTTTTTTITPTTTTTGTTTTTTSNYTTTSTVTSTTTTTSSAATATSLITQPNDSSAYFILGIFATIPAGLMILRRRRPNTPPPPKEPEQPPPLQEQQEGGESE